MKTEKQLEEICEFIKPYSETLNMPPYRCTNNKPCEDKLVYSLESYCRRMLRNKIEDLK